MHAHAHPTYMSRKNLTEIAHYAELALQFIDEENGERMPEWMFYKISAVRTHMKDIGHFLRYETSNDRRERKSKGKDARERKYGSHHPRMAPKMLRQIHEYACASLEILQGVDHRIPQWVDHKLSVCAEYMDCIGHCLEDEARQGRRYAGPQWNTQSGFEGIKAGFELQGAMHRGDGHTNAGVRFAAATRRPGAPREPAREVPLKVLGDARRPPASISANEAPPAMLNTGEGDDKIVIVRKVVGDDDGFTGAAVGGANHNIARPPGDFMPGLRMKVGNRMGRENRMLHRQPPEAHQPEGTRRRYEWKDFEPAERRYGVPGYVYGEPGWAGHGGVAQRPLGRVRGGGAVQTYGSLGYGSMGDGSMDAAVRGGGRRFAGGEWGGVVIGGQALVPMRGRPAPANLSQGNRGLPPPAYVSSVRGRKFRKLAKKGGR